MGALLRHDRLLKHFLLRELSLLLGNHVVDLEDHLDDLRRKLEHLHLARQRVVDVQLLHVVGANRRAVNAEPWVLLGLLTSAKKQLQQ